MTPLDGFAAGGVVAVALTALKVVERVVGKRAASNGVCFGSQDREILNRLTDCQQKQTILMTRMNDALEAHQKQTETYVTLLTTKINGARKE